MAEWVYTNQKWTRELGFLKEKINLGCNATVANRQHQFYDFFLSAERLSKKWTVGREAKLRGQLLNF